MDTTKTQHQIMDMILSWAERTPNIRAVVLSGSHASHLLEVDPLATYHFQLVVADLNTLIWQDDWLETFGESLTTLQHIRHHSVTGAVACTQQVLYSDGIEIQFQIYPVSEWEYQMAIEPSTSIIPLLYQIILDKDHLIENSIVTSDQQSVPLRKPIHQEYELVQHEFWWYSIQAGKSLWRNQLHVAKYQIDHILRMNYLEKMLDWYACSLQDWDLMYHHDRAEYRQHLDPELAQALATTYAGISIEENWNSLLQITKLFRSLAIEVAESTGYEYDHEQDRRITAYLSQLQANK